MGSSVVGATTFYKTKNVITDGYHTQFSYAIEASLMPLGMPECRLGIDGKIVARFWLR